jgi:hypothetical protein
VQIGTGNRKFLILKQLIKLSLKQVAAIRPVVPLLQIKWITAKTIDQAMTALLNIGLHAFNTRTKTLKLSLASQILHIIRGAGFIFIAIRLNLYLLLAAIRKTADELK